jgi:hypothetical protein
MTLNEREAFEELPEIKDKLHAVYFNESFNSYFAAMINSSPTVKYVQGAWMAWQAKAQAVPDTHVLVEKSKISTWWQDADEPENFASTEEQLFGMIAESEIYIDDMLVVEKHVQAQLSTQKLYCVYQITNKETGLAEIKICESKSEAEEILKNNAKWVAEKEADQYESMNAFFEEEERKSGAEG